MKATVLAVTSIFLLVAIVVPQTQHQINLGTLPTGIQIDTPKGIQVPSTAFRGFGLNPGTTPNVSYDPWLKQRADELLSLLGCYLDKNSLANEVAVEQKASLGNTGAIELRIKLLKTLAQKNVRSGCK